jgi:hypothetical protein
MKILFYFCIAFTLTIVMAQNKAPIIYPHFMVKSNQTLYPGRYSKIFLPTNLLIVFQVAKIYDYSFYLSPLYPPSTVIENTNAIDICACKLFFNRKFLTQQLRIIIFLLLVKTIFVEMELYLT